MDKLNKVFVTGATGFIGKRLVSSLLDDGMEVYALARKGDPENRDGVRPITGDITEKISLPPGVSAVYHCAGVISRQEDMEKVNVLGTQNIVEAALKAGCRLLHLSSAGVVGKAEGDRIDENTPCDPRAPYERTKLEAERVVLQGVSSGLKAQILRPTIIFGVGREPSKDSFLQLVSAMKSGRYRAIGNGDGIYNIVHVDEVVSAMRALDTDAIPNGGVFFINSPVTFREMHEIVSGKADGPRGIPYPAALCAAAFFSMVSLATGLRMPLTLSRLRALTNRNIFLQERLIKTTPYRPAASVNEYIRRVCVEYAERGLLG